MYINDIHILYYTLVAILGGIVGQFVDYCNKVFLKDEKVLSKKNFKEYTKICTPNYVLILVTMLSYILLLYTCYIKYEFLILTLPTNYIFNKWTKWWEMISIIKINKTDQLSFLTIDENSKDVPSKVSIPNLKLNANLNDIATVVNSYA